MDAGQRGYVESIAEYAAATVANDKLGDRHVAQAVDGVLTRVLYGAIGDDTVAQTSDAVGVAGNECESTKIKRRVGTQLHRCPNNRGAIEVGREESISVDQLTTAGHLSSGQGRHYS